MDASAYAMGERPVAISRTDQPSKQSAVKQKTSQVGLKGVQLLSFVAIILGIAGFSKSGLSGVFHDSFTAARVTFGVGVGCFVLTGIKRSCCSGEKDKVDVRTKLERSLQARRGFLEEAQRDLLSSTNFIISMLEEIDGFFGPASISEENRIRLAGVIQGQTKRDVRSVENIKEESWDGTHKRWQERVLGPSGMQKIYHDAMAQGLLRSDPTADLTISMKRSAHYLAVTKRYDQQYRDALFRNGKSQIRIERLTGQIARLEENLRMLPTEEAALVNGGHETTEEL